MKFRTKQSLLLAALAATGVEVLSPATAQAAGTIYQTGDLLYAEKSITDLYFGHAGLIYTGGAVPKVADVSTGRDPHALHVDRSGTGFPTVWTRRHSSQRPGLASSYKAAMKARIDYFNSYRTEYDGAHNNQKGGYFEYWIGTRHYWEFDCVGFTERVYQDIGLNITPSSFEDGGGWPLTVYEQRDHGVTIPAETQKVAGDFNGDGRTDIALTGGPGWTTLPVAFSDGGGGFNVTNAGVDYIPGWSRTARVQAVTGDFNRDGRADIAIPGGAGFTSLPIAFSNGNGSFAPVAYAASELGAHASLEGVQAVSGDFNGDGYSDIALPGVVGSGTTVTIARALGDGQWLALKPEVGAFASWAQTPGVKITAGDFNGDGRSDIALTGAAGWTTVPIAFSQANGTFAVTNGNVPNVPAWAASEGVNVTASDVNRDGRTDLVLTGGPNWASIPVALSNGDGTFQVSNVGEANVSSWSQLSGAKTLAGDFNGDGYGDISLTGGLAWGSIPVGFSTGGGGFNVTNASVANFPAWAVSQ